MASPLGLAGLLGRENLQRRLPDRPTQEELKEKFANYFYGTGGLYGDKITEEGLASYMKDDPLYGAYDMPYNMDQLKSFAQDPRQTIPSLLEDKRLMGYTYGNSPDESLYIRDINKFVNEPDLLNPNTMGNIYKTNKQIADVIGHEGRHQLLDDPKFADIKEQFESALPKKGTWGPYAKKYQEEIFNRILDLKSGQLRGQLEGDEFGLNAMEGDYRDMDYLDWKLKDTENIPMMGTGAAWMQKLDPLADEFIERARDMAIKRKRMRDKRATEQGMAQAAMQKQIQDAEAAHAAAYISRHPPISTGGVSEAARQEGRNPSARTFSSYSPGNISQATSRAARGDPQGTGGGWKWAHGGMVDKTLPGRSRDI